MNSIRIKYTDFENEFRPHQMIRIERTYVIYVALFLADKIDKYNIRVSIVLRSFMNGVYY